MPARIFLSNEDDYPGVIDEVQVASDRLSQGIPHRSVWTCSNIRNIQVGDIAYFKRVMYKPCGIFARGRIIAAPAEFQLRQLEPSRQDVGAAYCLGNYDMATGFFEHTLYNPNHDLVIFYEWDSVVDYDHPLDTDILKHQEDYKDVSFDLRRSGQTFIRASGDILEPTWAEHSARLAKQQLGARIIDGYFSLGSQELQNAQYIDAIQRFTDVLRTSPNHHEALFQRGLAHLELKQYDKAVQDFEASLSIEPRNPDAHWHLGIIYTDLGNNNELALTHFKEAANLFRLYAWADRLQEAEEYIQLLTLETAEPIDSDLDHPPDEEPPTTLDNQAGDPSGEERSEQSDPPNSQVLSSLQHLQTAQAQLDQEGFFTPDSAVEAQERTTISIARRQGQAQFRQDLLEAYGYRCAITGCDAKEALEAAHIVPYSEQANNHPSNGLLLRADLHTLFDLRLIAIDPQTMTVRLAPLIQDSVYSAFEGQPLQLPLNREEQPHPSALQRHWQQCEWLRPSPQFLSL